MKRSSPLLVPIIFLAITLRFLTLKNLMPFTPDESYLAYIAQTIIKDFHVIWIGWSALGFDLYLGPFWIYIITPFLMLSKLDPVILGYLNSFFGVLTTILIYWLGKKMFNEKAGLIASLLYASLPLVVFYDQKAYPPAVPFLSVLIALALYMTKKSNKWWFLFAAAYGMVFHIHLSLILVIFIAFYWAWIRRRSLDFKIIAGSIVIFLLMTSPLIVFDYFKKGSNITAPLRAIQMARSQQAGIEVSYHWTSLVQTMGRIWYLKPFSESSDEILAPCANDSLSTFTKPPLIISLLSLFLLGYFVLKKNSWKNEQKRLLLLLSFSFLIPFTFLPIINPVEYYLLGFLPLFFLIVGIVLSELKAPWKLPAYLLVLAAISHGIFTIFVAKGSFGLATKQRIITRVSQTLGDESFYLDREGSCQKYGGWRYLFMTYGQRPAQSAEDKSFSWLHPEEISSETPKYTVIVKETRATQDIPIGYKSIIEEGGFTAFIYGP